MPERLMAYCGLVSTDCSAYIAKRTDDDALRAKTAKQWAGPDFPVSPDEINCDGCTALSGRWKFCEACEARTCAVPRGIATCAECTDYSCERLDKLLKMIGPEARATLDALRAG